MKTIDPLDNMINSPNEILLKDNSEIIITMGAGSIGKICQSLKKKLVIEN